MSNKPNRFARGLQLVLAALLCAGLSTGAQAAANAPAAPESAPVAQPIQELDQLDEIWVRGKYLSQVIEDAEDNFFKRYNKLNKDSQYDVFCGVMALNRGSMIMVRKCVPGFIVYNDYDVRTNTVRFDGGCVGVYGQAYGDTAYVTSCGSTYGNSGYAIDGYIASPMSQPSGLLMEQRRPAYARNALQVIGSDPQLLEMARKLGGLYDEMDLAQRRYVQVKQADKRLRPDRGSAKSVGPRAL